MHCNIAFRVILPLFWPTCADLQFSGILELFSLHSFQDGFSRSGENAFFLFKELPFANFRSLRVRKCGCWKAHLGWNQPPAPPLGRPARAAFERALQSAKDALKIASPLEVGGIFGRGNSLNPRCNEGTGVKWPWIYGWRYGRVMGMGFNDILTLKFPVAGWNLRTAARKIAKGGRKVLAYPSKH